MSTEPASGAASLTSAWHCQQQPVDAIAAACLDAALEHTASRLSDDALVVVARRSH